MTADAYDVTDWAIDGGWVECTVTRGDRSRRVRVALSIESTHEAAIREFDRLEAAQATPAQQYQPGCAKGAGP